MLPLVTTFLFVFWPFAAIVPIFWGIYQRRKWAYYCLALWLAFYSVYFIPSGDQFRFYQIFSGFPEVDWNLFNSQPFHYYSLVYVLMYIVREFGFHFEIVRLLWVLIGYAVYFGIWLDIHRDFDEDQKGEFILFLCYLMSVSFFNLALGFRSAMACAFALSSCYRFYFKKEKFAALLMAALSIMIHFQFVIVIMALGWLALGDLRKKQLLIGVLIAFVAGEWLLSGALNGMLSNASTELSYLSEYVSDDGFWKSGVVETYSGLHLLFDYFLKAARIAVVILYVTISDSYKNARLTSWRHLVYVLIIAWVLTFPYVTISGRVYSFMAPMMIIDIVVNNKENFRKDLVIILLGALAFLFAVDWASWRKHRAYSDESHFLCNDIFTLLTHTYDDKFIDANIDDGGHLIGEGAPK